MPDATIDSATLRIVAAFALDTNLRRAALELGLPRSTLSRHLAELEARLGQPIFSRRGRALTMTAFGERLVARAKTARDAMLDLETTAREPSLGGRTMTLAISPLFAEIVLPGVLPLLCERYPKARIRIALSHTYSDLFDDRVDVALRRGPLVDSASMNARRLGRLGMVCVATPKTLAGCVGSLDERIKALRWLRVAGSLEPFPLTVVGESPRNPRGHRTVTITPSIAVDSQRLALDLVLRGLGVARLNTFVARDYLSSGTLVEAIPEAHSSEAVFAVYPRRARPDPLVKDFVAAVVDHCRALDIWDP